MTELEKLPDKLPDNRYYIFHDPENAYSVFYKITNNKMLNKDTYRRKWYQDKKVININEIEKMGIYNKYFFGPFEDVLACQIYLRTNKLMGFINVNKKLEKQLNKHEDYLKFWKIQEKFDANQGNIRKLQIWMDDKQEKYPEYFL